MNIIKQFQKLNSTQQIELIKQLKNKVGSQTKILSLRPEITNCSHCNSKNIVKFGTYSGKRRFKCKDCKKTFSELSGTSISYIKKPEKWFPFIDLMLENKTIREISKELDLNTHTVFDWRHKVLSSLEEIFTKEFRGIVETDDIYFLLNQKGRKKNFVDLGKRKRGISDQQISVMVTSDRYGTIDMRTVKRGRILKKDLERVIDKKRLNKDNIICSDKHPSITSFVKSLGLEHIKLNSSKKQYVIDNIYHVQKVNNITSDFRKWVSGNFNNVSSKYLQNYLFWYKINQVIKLDKKDNEVEKFLEYSLKDTKTIKRKNNIETEYQKILSY